MSYHRCCPNYFPQQQLCIYLSKRHCAAVCFRLVHERNLIGGELGQISGRCTQAHSGRANLCLCARHSATSYPSSDRLDSIQMKEPDWNVQ
ncbi:hypothetical protein ACTXT7_015968, partial [Hymenolepis weldensis]